MHNQSRKCLVPLRLPRFGLQVGAKTRWQKLPAIKLTATATKDKTGGANCVTCNGTTLVIELSCWVSLLVLVSSLVVAGIDGQSMVILGSRLCP